jgi:hypothetical protein
VKRTAALALAAAFALASCSGAAASPRQTSSLIPGPAAATAVPTAVPTIPAVSVPSPTPDRAAPGLATSSPTSAPTETGYDAASARFVAIDTAYVDAYMAFSTKMLSTSWTYAEAQSYYRGLLAVVERFATDLRTTTFPRSVSPDARLLQKRVSDFLALMKSLGETRDENAGWLLYDRVVKADTATDAARVVVGRDLGLSYSVPPAPAATAHATARPTPVATLKPTPVAVATETPVAVATETPVAVATETPVAVATETPVATPVPAPTATPTPPTAFPPGFVSATEAIDHLGQVVTVCGRVASTNYAVTSLGSPTFLDLDRPYPTNPFTILIWPEHRASYGGAPERRFLGSRVCITGPVSVNKGVAQIVSNGGDITVYD